MKALVYHGPGKKQLEDMPKPLLREATDAVVRMTKTTICGTDLHILKGDLPAVAAGRILGHEGIGIIDEAGTGVSRFHKGDRVLISCITACGKCDYCRRGMPSHCEQGGWILGNTIDGTQAEYVRIPFADASLYPIPGERRGGDGDAQRHPANRLRVRRAQRRGQAGRHGGHRRRRTRRPGGAADGAILRPGEAHRD